MFTVGLSLVARSILGVWALALLLNLLVSPQGAAAAESLRVGRIRWGYYVGYEADSFAHLQRHIHDLDYVSPYWFQMDGEGGIIESGIRYIEDKNKDGVMALARGNGVKVVPMIKNSATGSDLTPVLADAGVRARTIQGLVALVERGYDGIHIDFENINGQDRPHLTTFMAELAAALRPRGKLVTQALAAKVEEKFTGWAGAYDFKGLAEHNDLLVLMAYGYRTAGSTVPGSTAPIDWVDKCLDYATSQIPPEKLMLGVAWYGYDWNKTTGPPAVALRYSQVMEIAQRTGAAVEYSEDGSPFLRYRSNGHDHEVWFEDRRSVEAKLALVPKYGVAGVAGWRMGHEDPGAWRAMNASLAFHTWLLAEGCTAPPYDTWILIMNPNPHHVPTTVTFMKEGGGTVVKEYRIPPTSRFTIFANDVVPNAAISTRVESDSPLIVERAMYFGHDGHVSAGVNAPSCLWYLPEGYTGGMDTWILLMNPNPTTALATVSFLKEDGSVEKRSYQLKPTSRLSIFANQIVPGISFSTTVEADLPVVAERATYFDGGKGGHGSVGVPYAARKWYLAEGFSGGMDTWVLLMNPGSATTRATVTFMKEDGETVVCAYNLTPTSRFTVYANTFVPGVSFATRVEADQPIIVERAMYFEGGTSGHSSMGVSAPARSWFLAEGCTAVPFTEFALLMNPNPTRVTASVSFVKDDGWVVTRQWEIGAFSRFTILVNGVVPNASLSLRVEATQPIVVERAMYFGKGGHASTGVSQ
ncbi:MAG: glycosyl hydrolase family 18 protein [Chloroflexota bacterium]